MGMLREVFDAPTKGDPTVRGDCVKDPTPRFRVQKGKSGPRLVKYAYNASQRRAPHDMILGGTPYKGGEWVDDHGLAHATPQQLAMLGMSPAEAQSALAAGKVAPHPNSAAAAPSKPNKNGTPGKFRATEDMLPDDLKGLLHVENLAAITSQEGLDTFVGMVRHSQQNLPGGEIPSQRHLEALLEAGESVGGHYAEAMEALTNVFGLKGARMWAVANGILSAQTKWEEHSVGAFRLIGGWLAAGSPRDPQAIDDLVQDWVDTRKPSGAYAYALWDDEKENKVKALLADPDEVSLHMMGGNDWAKTPEFAGSFLDGTRVAIDAHMLKPVGMGQTADKVAELAGDIAGNPVKYAAYKASVADLARKKGITAASAQEQAWSAVLGVALMQRHGMAADDVNEYLTHGTVGQNWDIHAQLANPEIRSVIDKIDYGKLGLSKPDMEGLGRQGPGQGGLEKRGLRPDQPVRVSDPDALREVARHVGPGSNSLGKGIRPILPEGKEPPGWNPDHGLISPEAKGGGPKPWEIEPIGAPRTIPRLKAAGQYPGGKRIPKSVRDKERHAAHKASQGAEKAPAAPPMKLAASKAPKAEKKAKKAEEATEPRKSDAEGGRVPAEEAREAKEATDPRKKAKAKKKHARSGDLLRLLRHGRDAKPKAEPAAALTRADLDRLDLKTLFRIYRERNAPQSSSKAKAV